MPRHTWTIATVLTAILIAVLAGVSTWRRTAELAEAQQHLAQAQQAAATNAAQAGELQTRWQAAEARVAELEHQTEQATQAQKSLESEMRHALESRDVTISELQGRLTVNILDRILFDSGEAQLKPEGEAVLRQVATVLAQYPSRQVHVIGHTDNVPIRPGMRARFPSNWELSTARATAAVRFLTEQAGVDSRRLGAVGYGEFHPLADNATPEGRARNRRIAVVVMSEELAGSDAAQPVVPRGPLPAVPVAPDRTEPATNPPAAEP